MFTPTQFSQNLSWKMCTHFFTRGLKKSTHHWIVELEGRITRSFSSLSHKIAETTSAKGDKLRTCYSTLRYAEAMYLIAIKGS
jgi:hypothetical protein